MMTKNSSATIISGSQKSRACRSWRRSVRAITHDGPRLAVARLDGSLVLLADREVELFERGRLRLHPGEAGAGRDERVDEVGHVASRCSSSTVATPLRWYPRTNGSACAESSSDGSSASMTTRALRARTGG